MIGFEWFWIIYRSDEDWRSNVGAGEVMLDSNPPHLTKHITAAQSIQRTLGAPLLAIDFVERGTERLALDLNVAPEIGGTGLQRRVTASWVVKQIADWLRTI